MGLAPDILHLRPWTTTTGRVPVPLFQQPRPRWRRRSSRRVSLCRCRFAGRHVGSGHDAGGRRRLSTVRLRLRRSGRCGRGERPVVRRCPDQADTGAQGQPAVCRLRRRHEGLALRALRIHGQHGGHHHDARQHRLAARRQDLPEDRVPGQRPMGRSALAVAGKRLGRRPARRPESQRGGGLLGHAERLGLAPSGRGENPGNSGREGACPIFSQPRAEGGEPFVSCSACSTATNPTATPRKAS
jgi:hypothetical protein